MSDVNPKTLALMMYKLIIETNSMVRELMAQQAEDRVTLSAIADAVGVVDDNDQLSKLRGRMLKHSIKMSEFAACINEGLSKTRVEQWAALVDLSKTGNVEDYQLLLDVKEVLENRKYPIN